jgi:hypothetical protein
MELKILSKGMRSLEILAMMPVFFVGSEDGSRGRLTLEPEDAREETLWRDMVRELGRERWVGSKVP